MFTYFFPKTTICIVVPLCNQSSHLSEHFQLEGKFFLVISNFLALVDYASVPVNATIQISDSDLVGSQFPFSLRQSIDDSVDWRREEIVFPLKYSTFARKIRREKSF